MKEAILTLLLFFIFICSFSQKWKPNIGIEGGIGGGGMTALLKTNNDLITDNSALKKDFAYIGGAFLQLMREGYGFEISADYNAYSAEAESFTTPENIKLRYLSVPLVFKIRLSKGEGYQSGSWSDESYSLIGNTLYHSPSEYSPGGSFTRSVFLYAGGQYDMLKKATHTYGTTNEVTDDISGLLTDTGYSLLIGAEIAVNMMSIDLSYQHGLKSIHPTSDNRINAVMFKFKFRIL
jgi:hypothetical protein